MTTEFVPKPRSQPEQTTEDVRDPREGTPASRPTPERVEDLLDTVQRRYRLPTEEWNREATSLATKVGLSGVTVRADDEARAITEAEAARGVARDGVVYLHPDRVQPGTPDGREVLAHELIHLKQAQLGSATGALDEDRAAAEEEADQLARSLSTGASVVPRCPIDLAVAAADADGKRSVEHKQRSRKKATGVADFDPRAQAARPRVDILTVEHTVTSKALDGKLAEADLLFEKLIDLGTEHARAPDVAAQIDAILGDVDARLSEAEAKALPAAEADAIQAVRQSWEYLRDDTAETLIELLGPRTGLPLVDKGPLCSPTDGSEPPTHGCFLTEKMRNLARESLVKYSDSSMENYHAALQNARVDELVASPHGWGFLAEFLFNSVSGGLIGAALKGLAAVRKSVKAGEEAAVLAAAFGVGGELDRSGLGRIAGVNDETIKAVLSNASRGIRNELRSGYGRYLGKVNRARAGFLEILQDQIKPLSDSIATVAPTELDDAGLIALARSYQDPSAHSVSAYRGYVDAMIAAYEGSKISLIGTEFAGGGRYELVNKGSVYKVIKQHGTGVIREVHNSIGGRADQYYVVYDDGRTEVVGTVPKELEEMAIGVSEEREAQRAAGEAAEAARDVKWRQMQDTARVEETEQSRRLDRRGR